MSAHSRAHVRWQCPAIVGNKAKRDGGSGLPRALLARQGTTQVHEVRVVLSSSPVLPMSGLDSQPHSRCMKPVGLSMRIRRNRSRDCGSFSSCPWASSPASSCGKQQRLPRWVGRHLRVDCSTMNVVERYSSSLSGGEDALRVATYWTNGIIVRVQSPYPRYRTC